MFKELWIVSLSKLIFMEQKKLMLLGGLRYLLPVIKAAHKLGYYVGCPVLCSNINSLV